LGFELSVKVEQLTNERPFTWEQVASRFNFNQLKDLFDKWQSNPHSQVAFSA